METNLEVQSMMDSFGESVARLASAAGLIERAIARLEQREPGSGAEMNIVATTDLDAGRRRELDLEQKLQQAEAQISELKAQASRAASTRKTISSSTTQLLAKQGITSLESIEAGALDAALAGLSLEQRIAVKSQLLRAGSPV